MHLTSLILFNLNTVYVGPDLYRGNVLQYWRRDVNLKMME